VARYCSEVLGMSEKILGIVHGVIALVSPPKNIQGSNHCFGFRLAMSRFIKIRRWLENSLSAPSFRSPRRSKAHLWTTNEKIHAEKISHFLWRTARINRFYVFFIPLRHPETHYEGNKEGERHDGKNDPEMFWTLSD
jgi:hypothetical protein